MPKGVKTVSILSEPLSSSSAAPGQSDCSSSACTPASSAACSASRPSPSWSASSQSELDRLEKGEWKKCYCGTKLKEWLNCQKNCLTLTSAFAPSSKFSNQGFFNLANSIRDVLGHKGRRRRHVCRAKLNYRTICAKIANKYKCVSAIGGIESIDAMLLEGCVCSQLLDSERFTVLQEGWALNICQF